MLIANASASHQLLPCFWGPAVPSLWVLNLLPPVPARTTGSGEVCKSYFNQSHKVHLGFLSGSVVKNLPAKAGDVGSIPVLGRSPGGGHSNPLQCVCLENPLERGAWQATVLRVTKSQNQPSTHRCIRSFGQLDESWKLAAYWANLQALISLSFFNWNIADVQHYVSFSWATQWFDICVHFAMIAVISLLIFLEHYHEIILCSMFSWLIFSLCWRGAALEEPQGPMWQRFCPCRASNLDLHGHWVTHTWIGGGVTRHRALELREGGRCSNSGCGWAAWGHGTWAGPEMWEEQRPGRDLLTHACHMAAAHWVFPATPLFAQDFSLSHRTYSNNPKYHLLVPSLPWCQSYLPKTQFWMLSNSGTWQWCPLPTTQ